MGKFCCIGLLRANGQSNTKRNKMECWVILLDFEAYSQICVLKAWSPVQGSAWGCGGVIGPLRLGFDQ